MGLLSGKWPWRRFLLNRGILLFLALKTSWWCTLSLFWFNWAFYCFPSEKQNSFNILRWECMAELPAKTSIFHWLCPIFVSAAQKLAWIGILFLYPSDSPYYFPSSEKKSGKFLNMAMIPEQTTAQFFLLSPFWSFSVVAKGWIVATLVIVLLLNVSSDTFTFVIITFHPY